MKWLSNFLKGNKKVVAGLLAAIMVSAGVPIFMATPLSDQAVDKIAEEVAEKVEKDEQKDKDKKKAETEKQADATLE